MRLFPGLFDIKLDPSRFLFPKEVNGEYETCAYYPLVGSDAEVFKILVAQKQLTYLVLTGQKPSIGENVMMPRPDTGTNTRMVVTKYYRPDNLYEMRFDNAGIVCSGRSGSPVMKLDGKLITNKIYGVLSLMDLTGVRRDIYGNTNLPCSGVGLFRPND